MAGFGLFMGSVENKDVELQLPTSMFSVVQLKLLFYFLISCVKNLCKLHSVAEVCKDDDLSQFELC